MRLDISNTGGPRSRNSALTLIEVVTAIAIVAAVFGGIIVAYTQAARRAQWTGLSLAAQGLAIQQIEQARCADWDPCMNPYRNEITNLVLINPTFTVLPPAYTLNGYTWTNLDVPTSGTNVIPATNWVTVRMLTYLEGANPINGVYIQMIRVDTVWPFSWGGTTRLYTNTVCTYTAPDNRDSTTL